MKPERSSNGQVVYLKCSTTLLAIPDRQASKVCSDIPLIALKDGACLTKKKTKFSSSLSRSIVVSAGRLYGALLDPLMSPIKNAGQGLGDCFRLSRVNSLT